MNTRFVALAESALVLAVLTALHELIRHLGGSVAVGSMATFAALALCTFLLPRHGLSWGALGLRRPDNVSKTLAWGAGLFVLEMLAQPLISGPIGNAFGWPPQQLQAFAALRGNTALYLVMLFPVAWGAAAIGEELIFRGFLNERFTRAFGGSQSAVIAACVVQATLFGAGHAYLGPRGALSAGVLGLIAGAAYLLGGRRLWPLVIAHGLVDSVGLTVLYLGTPLS